MFRGDTRQIDVKGWRRGALPPGIWHPMDAWRLQRGCFKGFSPKSGASHQPNLQKALHRVTLEGNSQGGAEAWGRWGSRAGGTMVARARPHRPHHIWSQETGGEPGKGSLFQPLPSVFYQNRPLLKLRRPLESFWPKPVRVTLEQVSAGRGA